MTFHTAMISATAALAMLSGAVPASAQVPDIEPAQVSAVARYFLPLAFEGFMLRCEGTLEPTGFARANQARLMTKFADGAEGYWPQAKQALIQLVAIEGGASEQEAISKVDDQTLQTFMAGMLFSALILELKLEDCAKIESGLEVLDLLSVDDMAQLFSILVKLGINANLADARPPEPSE